MKFTKGKSGNPAGKKKGTINKRTQLAKLLEPHAEELVAKAVELARGGCVNSLRMCLDRLIPKATHEPIEFEFSSGEINTSEYLLEYGRQILIAVSNGQIMPTDAKILSGIADNHRRLIENSELKRMMEEIKLAIKMGKGN